MEVENANGTLIYQATFFDYQEYRLQFILQDYLCLAPVFLLSYQTLNPGYSYLLDLKHLPNISPYNVEKKLPTLLTFL